MFPPSLQTFTISQSYVWDNYAPSSFHNYTKDTSQITKNFGKAWFTIPENITIAKTRVKNQLITATKIVIMKIAIAKITWIKNEKLAKIFFIFVSNIMWNLVITDTLTGTSRCGRKQTYSHVTIGRESWVSLTIQKLSKMW